MIDNKTSRLQLPLPNVENYLEEDVERLSEALTTLDGVVATIAEDGKLVQDQVPEYVARLDTEGRLPSDNLPVTAVQTDGEGKIAASVIPEEIARDAEVLSRNGNLSELADRAAAWLNVRPVGSTPLAGDPVGDYDAATKRWVQNLLSTGTTGPTMNGVMNYGVGDFHLRDSRAYIQPYEVVADGQLLNRADWPELWAYAQMLSPISDADWLADKFKRGRYSTGNGTTTFRVPDKNGVQTGSVRALYGRGDGGSSSANGTIFESAAPNIWGRIASYSGSSYSQVFGDIAQGAFQTNNDLFPAASGDAIPDTGAIAIPGRFNTLVFDASRSSPIYGGSSDEILTRNFVGVWVIRASGGFVAANTSWSVINKDASAPPLNTSVVGGKVESKYSNTASSQYARMYVNSSWGSSCSAVIEAQGSSLSQYRFGEDGTVNFRNAGKFNRLLSYVSGQGWNDVIKSDAPDVISGVNLRVQAPLEDAVVPGMSLYAIKASGYPTKVGFHQWFPGGQGFGSALITVAGDNNAFCRYFLDITGQIYGSTNNGDFSYTRNGVSDERVKHSIAPTSVDTAWSNLQGLQFYNFVYNNDVQERVRRGLIAQQAETVDPLYVKTRMYPGTEPGAPEVEQKELDTTPMLLDTMHVVQTLMLKIEALEAEIAELKASK